MRKTKIIATLGPSTDSPEMLAVMMKTGVNIFRLNMSHARHDWVREVVSNIRRISTELNLPIAILMDTQGPAIRTGDLPTKLSLVPGDKFTFTVRGAVSEEQHSVDVNYDNLVDDISVGDVVLLDNGVIRMRVLSKEENKLNCEVLTPGELGSRRHINLPGVKVSLPALTEKDLADVAVGAECGVDFFALSFVREANDVQLLRQQLQAHGSDAKIIAKIEDQSAVRNIQEIIDVADGIMVARGDLGIEIPYEELPIVQRRIVKACVQQVKPVIVATHMLESMIQNPMPTRAEITDIANAVYEQADAIMLSGETTVGKYPRECVEVLDRVATRIERSDHEHLGDSINLFDDTERLARSAVHLANETRAEGICVFTAKGYMARIAAGLRPIYSKVFAFTQDERVAQQLCLNYGVRPIQIRFDRDVEMNVLSAEEKLKKFGLVKPGAKLVVISDLVVGDAMVHAVHMRLVK
jgi:pyruvate kinase